MIYFTKIERNKASFRLSIPSKLCRELKLQRGDIFMVEAFNPETLVFRLYEPKLSREYEEGIEKLKIINYDK